MLLAQRVDPSREEERARVPFARVAEPPQALAVGGGHGHLDRMFDSGVAPDVLDVPDSAFDGGLVTAGLGLALHFFVVFAVVSAFYLASRKIPFLTRQPFVSGVLYGIGVFVVMFWFVLPTVFSTFRHRLSNELLQLAIHICLIGLPTAFIVRRCSEVTEQSS